MTIQACGTLWTKHPFLYIYVGIIGYNTAVFGTAVILIAGLQQRVHTPAHLRPPSSQKLYTNPPFWERRSILVSEADDTKM